MKEKKIIHCRVCRKEIKSGEELIVAHRLISIITLHKKCYKEVLDKGSMPFLGGAPINGKMSNISTVIAAVLGVVLLYFPDRSYISILCLIYLLVRFYSWFRYERHF